MASEAVGGEVVEVAGAFARGVWVREGEDVEGLEQGLEVDLETWWIGSVVLGRGWEGRVVRVGCEEGTLKKYKGFHYAALFGAEAKAFGRDADLGFLCEGNAAEEKEKLASRGGNSGKDRDRVGHFLSSLQKV